MLLFPFLIHSYSVPDELMHKYSIISFLLSLFFFFFQTFFTYKNPAKMQWSMKLQKPWVTRNSDSPKNPVQYEEVHRSLKCCHHLQHTVLQLFKIACYYRARWEEHFNQLHLEEL